MIWIKNSILLIVLYRQCLLGVSSRAKRDFNKNCGGYEFRVAKDKLPFHPNHSTSSNLVPVDDILSGTPHITNSHFNFQQKKMQFDLVILIYLYGPNSVRYQLTEKMFQHYHTMQEMFRDYAKFTFTIVGSENDLSRTLSSKYFPSNSYYEFDQNNMSKISDPNYVDATPFKYEQIRRKVNFGMRTAYTKARDDSPVDIIFWVGSNDYISLSFWRQVIEDYNPVTLKWYGLTTFFQGHNVCYFTQYDGKFMLERTGTVPFFSNGKQPLQRRKLNYIGPVNGVTRSAIDLYPSILDFWNHDEGRVEEYVLNVSMSNPNPEERIHGFQSDECFSMNIKASTGDQDVTTWKSLEFKLKVQCPYGVSPKFMSDLFLHNFDEEFTVFNQLTV